MVRAPITLNSLETPPLLAYQESTPVASEVLGAEELEIFGYVAKKPH